MHGCLHGSYNTEKEEEERRAVLQKERLVRLEEAKAAEQAKEEAERVGRSFMHAVCHQHIRDVWQAVHLNVCVYVCFFQLAVWNNGHTHTIMRTYRLEVFVRRCCVASLVPQLWGLLVTRLEYPGIPLRSSQGVLSMQPVAHVENIRICAYWCLLKHNHSVSL